MEAKEKNAEPKIYKAMLGIMKDISPIAKAEKNAQQNFMYRGIDTIMNDLHDIFVKHGVFIIPESLEGDQRERVSSQGKALFYSFERMKYTFMCDDGSSVFAIIKGEGMDSGDKGTNKAMSIALKYCLIQMFLIPTAEDKDPDKETHELKPKNNQKEEISSEAALIASATKELNECKDLKILSSIWGKYPSLQTHEVFVLTFKRIKTELKKGTQNGTGNSAV